MASEVQNLQIIHPRPSSIVAALYTLRDLGADVVILHGPSGCCFKHARLLEEDGVRVLTTALDEAGFVFGGQKPLTKLLKRARELFNPKLMAVSGTCSSMIIGEDLHQAVLEANLDIPVLEVEVHAGYRDNTRGVILTLEAAKDKGIIDEQEFVGRSFCLRKPRRSRGFMEQPARNILHLNAVTSSLRQQPDCSSSSTMARGA